MRLCTLLFLTSISFGAGNPGLLNTDVSVTTLLSEYHPATPQECAVLAIGGPELLRYSMISDFIETGVLELTYVEMGTDYADFSIGKFQMKPTFIEQLEFLICDHQILAERYEKLIFYPSGDAKTIRAERIDRMKSGDFQMLYLKAFNDYCRIIYCTFLDTISDEEVVGFIGAAYNLGFGHSEQNIRDHMLRRHFPYGPKYTGSQEAYASLSTRIFKQLTESLCKNSQSLSSQACSSGPARNFPSSGLLLKE